MRRPRVTLIVLTAAAVLGAAAGGVGCGGARRPPGSSSGPGAARAVRPVAVPVVTPAAAARLGLTRRHAAAYRRVCAEWAASAPPRARICPPLVPRGGGKVLAAQPFSRQARHRGGYLADLATPALSTLRGRRVPTNGGHWHVDVSWTPAVRELLVRRGIEQPGNAGGRRSRCRRLRLGGERVEACDVVPYEQGGGLSGGHVAYVWRRGSVTRVVSLHGYANRPRARAMMLAWIGAVLG